MNKDLNAPIFPTVLACCVRKAASTVFHPTLSHSQSLRQAHVLSPPMTNAKKKTGLALLPLISKKQTKKKNREQGTPVSSSNHGNSSELLYMTFVRPIEI